MFAETFDQELTVSQLACGGTIIADESDLPAVLAETSQPHLAIYNQWGIFQSSEPQEYFTSKLKKFELDPRHILHNI
jgi:hypothetical protein